MSAYIVSDKTITAIVEGMKHMEFPAVIFDEEKGDIYNPRTRPQEVGQIFLDQNYASVNYRYNEETKPHRFKMEYKVNDRGYRDDFTLGEIYGCVCCYIYQSCETPNFSNTQIYQALQSLKDDLMEKALDKLDDSMKWGI